MDESPAEPVADLAGTASLPGRRRKGRLRRRLTVVLLVLLGLWLASSISGGGTRTEWCTRCGRCRDVKVVVVCYVPFETVEPLPETFVTRYLEEKHGSCTSHDWQERGSDVTLGGCCCLLPSLGPHNNFRLLMVPTFQHPNAAAAFDKLRQHDPAKADALITELMKELGPGRWGNNPAVDWLREARHTDLHEYLIEHVDELLDRD